MTRRASERCGEDACTRTTTMKLDVTRARPAVEAAATLHATSRSGAARRGSNSRVGVVGASPSPSAAECR